MTQPTSLHLFCGAGGDALGFQRAGFDADAQACRDVGYLTGVPGTVTDLAAIGPHDLAALTLTLSDAWTA